MSDLSLNGRLEHISGIKRLGQYLLDNAHTIENLICGYESVDPNGDQNLHFAYYGSLSAALGLQLMQGDYLDLRRPTLQDGE